MLARGNLEPGRAPVSEESRDPIHEVLLGRVDARLEIEERLGSIDGDAEPVSLHARGLASRRLEPRYQGEPRGAFDDEGGEARAFHPPVALAGEEG